MSAPAPGEDKPQGLSKFMRRASKVLKRGNSNKDSISGVAEPAPAAGSPSSPQSPLEVPKPDPIPSLSVPAAIQQPISDIRNPADKEMKAHTTAAASEGTREERARALFAKHGFTLEPGEWTPSSRGRGERVEKKIRFRVHRHCHRCQTTFGSERLCNNCQHTRCKKCPRFPPKQPSEQQAKALGTGVAPIRPQEAAKAQAKSRTKSLTMPSKTTGSDLVRKAPRQRVRRNCHKCNCVFISKETQCLGCKHSRCPQCPREPPKIHKYPNGYPGDTDETFPLAERQLRVIRTRIRWQCHTCSETFREHEKTCRSCKHERCNECFRQPPKSVKPEPDSNTIQSLDERLARVNISPQAA